MFVQNCGQHGQADQHLEAGCQGSPGRQPLGSETVGKHSATGQRRQEACQLGERTWSTAKVMVMGMALYSTQPST